MNRILLISLLLFAGNVSFAQDINKLINASEAARIENVLASDDMQGRKPFTQGIDKAADFISQEFQRSRLKFFKGLTNYKQSFSMTRAKFISANGELDNIAIDANNIIAVTTDSGLNFNETSGYDKAVIDTGANLMAEASKLLGENKKYLVLVNEAQAKNFNKLKRFKRESFEARQPVVFVLSNSNPTKYQFTISHQVSTMSLSNVVGVLPGKSKKDEYIIFSAHYDHLGIGKQNADGDSIYNGANDDAAGTTAVMLLANYFSEVKNNERTLIFVAFTAEEMGGFGSHYFSKQLDAEKTIAMFNIEMIGTESKWGKNSAYITGYERSDFGEILQKYLTGSAFKFEPDPYPKQQLFYRSDNATLAALGVPAHSISTAKMDQEKFYHSQDDEVITLDMENMAAIIRAIAISSKGIVSGKETPSRVEKLGK